MTPIRSHNSVVVCHRQKKDRVGVPEILLLKFIHKNALPYFEYYPEIAQERLPGGGCEGQESPEECARREFSEETGLRIRQKTPLVALTSIPYWGHLKNGFLCDRGGCRGTLTKHWRFERKIVIVGHAWATVSAALELIKPSPGNRSQHDIILAAREKLIEMGLLDPNVPQD